MWYCVEHVIAQAKGRARPQLRARGTHGASRACGEHEKGDDENDQEFMIGGGVPPVAFGGAEFMQGVFTVVEQVVGNMMQAIQVPVRIVDTKATMAMKAFLQLRLLTFKDESDPLVIEDWLEQVTMALDTILVMEEELRVFFASYQLQWDVP